MSSTLAANFHGESAGLLCAKSAPSRWWLPFALFVSMTLLPLRALADDECAEPAKQVKALVTALNKATAGNRASRRFDLRRLSSRHEAGKFQVACLVGGKPVFSQRLEQQAAVSDHFAASISRKSAAVLEVGYAFGVGGGVSCEYDIGRAPVEFVARRTK